MTNARSIIWKDVAGVTRQTIIRGTGSLIGPTLTTVQTDLLALSNAARFDAWEGATAGASGSAVLATYPNVGDTAVLVYAAVDGTMVYVTLPAPKASIFLADGETVDATQITTLSGDVAACVTTGSGALAVTFVGGQRRARNKEYQ